jgi:hypothetical protein
VVFSHQRVLAVLLLAPIVLIASATSSAQEPPQCLGEAATIVGTPGPDHLKGTRHKDVIQALGGDDVVNGRGGDDIICGDTGADELDGGRGDDQIHDGDGIDDDELEGGPGSDRLYGNLGDDELDGGRGNDQLFGGNGDEEGLHPGNDLLKGGPGDDYLNGGPGDDELWGGRGDDLLDGGPGDDEFHGGPGNDTIVDEPPTPPPATLASLIDSGDRAGIRDWAATQAIANLNSEVASLDQAHRDKLADVLLDTNATGENRDKMLRVFRAVLARPDLGFYAEIWSYTFIELTGGGFFGTCNHLFLSPDAWAGLSDYDATGVLMHESFHSFNCVNSGPAGALDEGSGIWVFQATLGGPLTAGQSFAETTYGTKLYYRDLNGQPDYPLAAAANPTQKLIDVYTWLSANDPSQLPWNSTERLVTCFNRYFADLNRNVDFFNVWLPAVKERSDLMLTDADCKPL